MIKKLIALAALASGTSFAHGWVQHGSLSVNEDSIKFIGNGCSADDAFVSFNGDGSFDLVFTNLQAESLGATVTSTCQFKFDARLPQGKTFATSKVQIGGVSQIQAQGGTTIASLRHTLAGTVGDAAIFNQQYDGNPDARDVRLEKDFSLAAKVWSPCGKDVGFKTTISLTARGDNSFINITDGGQSSSRKTYIRYYWSWGNC